MKHARKASRLIPCTAGTHVQMVENLQILHLINRNTAVAAYPAQFRRGLMLPLLSAHHVW